MAARALIALGAAALAAAAAAHAGAPGSGSPPGTPNTAAPLATPGPGGSPAAVELRWARLGAAFGEGELRVEGLPAGALARLPGGELDAATGESLLRVVVAPPATPAPVALGSLPNAWGAWGARDGALVFRPRHVLAPGATLHAAFSGARFDALTGGRGTVDATLRLDVPAGAGVATVLGATPAGDEVPENLLRLYVEFSHPMSMRGVERHVRLLDGDGVEIPGAFVEVPDGLWDPERRRLTLLVHPGRQKSGLAMRERLGPVLVQGGAVTLAVDAAALDAEGRPLARPFARSWRVGPARRAPLDPGEWVLSPPAAPREALRVGLPWPLDDALLRRALAVVDTRGEPVAAALAVSEDGRELRFTPAAEWRTGETYRLRVEGFLEDASGNRPGRAFETAAGARDESGPRELPFAPLAAAAAAATTAADDLAPPRGPQAKPP